jgi:glycosyltransferase involved in cell wall biosynthesis
MLERELLIGGAPEGAPAAAVPTRDLRAIVVIPARDEQDRISACLQALAAQTLRRDQFETIVVLDDCQDGTADAVSAAAAVLELDVTTIDGPGDGAGPARRAGMELACERFLTMGRTGGLIVCTDADSQPRADWLERQLGYVTDGAEAIAGLIELDPGEARGLPAAVLRRRALDAAHRLRQVRERDPDAGHHHAGGASLAVTAGAYRAVGGMAPLRSLEDEDFARKLERRGIKLLRPDDVVVRTSARATGRVERGLSVDLAVSIWLNRRRYNARDFSPGSLLRQKHDSRVSVIIPAKECAETVGGVIEQAVGPMLELGLVDEVVVVDAGSADGTAALAAAAGARVIQQDELNPELGPALGKGDAMWRALQATDGDIVCFLDADTADPHPYHLLGLLGPILSDRSVDLVKGTFERPLDTGGSRLANEGGRVTELMARPLLNLHHPLLAAFSQPLAGEMAARRRLLESVPFPVGYGIEIALLIDALGAGGLDSLAECDLGTRQNRHQPLRKLGEMAYAVLCAVERRSHAPESPVPVGTGRYLKPWEDGAMTDIHVLERPALNETSSAPAPEPAGSSAV